MLKVAIAVLLFVPAVASAVICKIVDEDGVVSYTSVPLAQCENVVRLPGYSSYAPRPIARTADATSGNADQQPAPFTGYRSINIDQPDSGGVVRSNEGLVNVSVALEPPLQEGHRLVLYLDGQAVAGSFSGLGVQLTGVERGTHSLQAAIRDSNGDQRIRSSSISFTLRKRGLYDGPKAGTLPPDQIRNPRAGYPSSTRPTNYGDTGSSDYASPAAPDYQPGQANYTPPTNAVPSTPGRTNPAFAPSYRP